MKVKTSLCSGVGTGGAQGAGAPPKFRYGRSASARRRNYAHARVTVMSKFVESHVPKIMQRQLESFFSATRENAAK